MPMRSLRLSFIGGKWFLPANDANGREFNPVQSPLPTRCLAVSGSRVIGGIGGRWFAPWAYSATGRWRRLVGAVDDFLNERLVGRAERRLGALDRADEIHRRARGPSSSGGTTMLRLTGRRSPGCIVRRRRARCCPARGPKSRCTGRRPCALERRRLSRLFISAHELNDIDWRSGT